MGGTAFNFGKAIPRLGSYIGATQRMMQAASEQSIDVMLSNHSGYDGTLVKLAELRKQPHAEPNPFVTGTPNAKRSVTVMNQCAQAARDRFSIWRILLASSESFQAHAGSGKSLAVFASEMSDIYATGEMR